MIPDPGHPGDHERISILEFAKRRNVTRQTIYKWIAKQKLPPKSLLLSPEGRYEIDWDVYKNAYLVVR